MHMKVTGEREGNRRAVVCVGGCVCAGERDRERGKKERMNVR